MLDTKLPSMTATAVAPSTKFSRSGLSYIPALPRLPHEVPNTEASSHSSNRSLSHEITDDSLVETPPAIRRGDHVPKQKLKKKEKAWSNVRCFPPPPVPFEGPPLGHQLKTKFMFGDILEDDEEDRRKPHAGENLGAVSYHINNTMPSGAQSFSMHPPYPEQTAVYTPPSNETMLFQKVLPAPYLPLGTYPPLPLHRPPTQPSHPITYSGSASTDRAGTHTPHEPQFYPHPFPQQAMNTEYPIHLPPPFSNHQFYMEPPPRNYAPYIPPPSSSGSSPTVNIHNAFLPSHHPNPPSSVHSINSEHLGQYPSLPFQSSLRSSVQLQSILPTYPQQSYPQLATYSEPRKYHVDDGSISDLERYTLSHFGKLTYSDMILSVKFSASPEESNGNCGFKMGFHSMLAGRIGFFRSAITESGVTPEKTIEVNVPAMIVAANSGEGSILKELKNLMSEESMKVAVAWAYGARKDSILEWLDSNSFECHLTTLVWGIEHIVEEVAETQAHKQSGQEISTSPDGAQTGISWADDFDVKGGTPDVALNNNNSDNTGAVGSCYVEHPRPVSSTDTEHSSPSADTAITHPAEHEGHKNPNLTLSVGEHYSNEKQALEKALSLLGCTILLGIPDLAHYCLEYIKRRCDTWPGAACALILLPKIVGFGTNISDDESQSSGFYTRALRGILLENTVGVFSDRLTNLALQYSDTSSDSLEKDALTKILKDVPYGLLKIIVERNNHIHPYSIGAKLRIIQSVMYERERRRKANSARLKTNLNKERDNPGVSERAVVVFDKFQGYHKNVSRSPQNSIVWGEAGRGYGSGCLRLERIEVRRKKTAKSTHK